MTVNHRRQRSGAADGGISAARLGDPPYVFSRRFRPGRVGRGPQRRCPFVQILGFWKIAPRVFPLPGLSRIRAWEFSGGAIYVTPKMGQDAPDFVEVGEAGVAVSDTMRHQRRVQLVG